jgi:predicted acyl esterase
VQSTTALMSDGVTLSVFVASPTDLTTGQLAPGPFPVLLTQIPYGTTGNDGNYFVQRGYIYVEMRVRGTQTSGGTFSFFSERDAQDGAELVTWATKLPNANGVVGMHGGSYQGLTQMHTAALLGLNSPVKAMAASCMGSEFYRETYFVGGIPTQTINFPSQFGANVGGTTAQPYGNAMLANVKFGGDYAYYRDFWKERSIVEKVQAVANTGIPALIWSSNNDIYAWSSLALYAYLQNAHAHQPIYGPMNPSITPTGIYQINISQGGHCAGEDQAIQLEWFETWLKGVNTGMDRTAMPLHVNEVGSNRWFNTSAYPVVPTYTKYYLDNSGVLSSTVPTSAGQETIAWAQPGPTSTVQYDSPMFANGGTLAGPIGASIYASSTTSNLELIATLQQVASDGTVTTLTSGTVLGSLSNNDPVRSWSDSAGTPIFPYGTYDLDRYKSALTVNKYDFLISPRFVHIASGAKLRVVFTTQYPSSSCGGSLGVNPCFPTLPQRTSLNAGQFSIYHGPTNSSSINLPLLPASCWHYSDDPSNPTPTDPHWGPTDPVVPNPGSPCQS